MRRGRGAGWADLAPDAGSARRDPLRDAPSRGVLPSRRSGVVGRLAAADDGGARGAGHPHRRGRRSRSPAWHYLDREDVDECVAPAAPRSRGGAGASSTPRSRRTRPTRARSATTTRPASRGCARPGYDRCAEGMIGFSIDLRRARAARARRPRPPRRARRRSPPPRVGHARRLRRRPAVRSLRRGVRGVHPIARLPRGLGPGRVGGSRGSRPRARSRGRIRSAASATSSRSRPIPTFHRRGFATAVVRDGLRRLRDAGMDAPSCTP